MDEKDLRQLRVREPWPFLDTLRIRNDFPQSVQDEGYRTYADLANQETISLFSSKRKRTTVGIPFSTLDLDGQLPYGIKIHSLGISFIAPAVVSQSEVGPETDAFESILFSVELPKLAGIVLFVNQDEKLINTCDLMPEGTGHGGIAQVDAAAGLSVISTLRNGVPALPNRWPFPEPLVIPRGSTISMELRLSQEARQMLRAMRGPGFWPFVDANGQPLATPVPKVSQIRVSAIVERDAQLREGYDAA